MSLHALCEPMFPTAKLGRLGSAPGAKASSSSSSSEMAASWSTYSPISSSRSRNLSVAARHGSAHASLTAVMAGHRSSCTGSGSGQRSGTRSSTRSQLSSNAAANERSASGLTAQANSSSRGRARSGSARSSSWKAAQRRSEATAELTSSSTSTRGGSPASSGNSLSRRRAKECSVPMAAPSSWSSATWQRPASTVPRYCPARRSISRRARSRSSSAALSVKVMAAIDRSSASPVATRATTRSTRAVVLPEPAPASTNKVDLRSDLMRARAAWSGAAACSGPGPSRSSVAAGCLGTGAVPLVPDLRRRGLGQVKESSQGGVRPLALQPAA